MKKRPGKHLDQATDIILNDKEMEDLVKQLVQKAHDSGACVTHLNRAISSVWQESFNVEIKPKKLNKKEEAFAKKVEKFLSHYENNLSEHLCKFSERYFFKFNKEYLYRFLCSMYGTFENEDTITKELMVKFAKEHGFNPYFHGFRDDISFLHDFISYHLHFYHDNTLPTYSEDCVGFDCSITSENDYSDFVKQYVLSNTKTCKTAIMVIWLIETFF